MSRTYDIKRGELIRINRYYKPEIQQAKADYKARKGLKIARGFEGSPEYWSVQRRINRAKLRSEKKYEVEAIALKIKREGKEAQIAGKKVRQITGEPQPFYMELSYGGKTDKLIIAEWKRGQRDGFVVAGVIYNTFKRTQYIYQDLFKFIQGIRGLYAELKGEQDKMNKGKANYKKGKGRVKLSTSSKKTTDEDKQGDNTKSTEEDPTIDYPLITTILVEDPVKKTLVITVKAHA